MELTKIKQKVSRLIEHWEKQNIGIVPMSVNEIESLLKKNAIPLPNDLKEFYSKANGMKSLYPNEIDEEGFLFYPVEAIISAEDEFENSGLKQK